MKPWTKRDRLESINFWLFIAIPTLIIFAIVLSFLDIKSVYYQLVGGNYTIEDVNRWDRILDLVTLVFSGIAIASFIASIALLFRNNFSKAKRNVVTLIPIVLIILYIAIIALMGTLLAINYYGLYISLTGPLTILSFVVSIVSFTGVLISEIINRRLKKRNQDNRKLLSIQALLVSLSLVSLVFVGFLNLLTPQDYPF